MATEHEQVDPTHPVSKFGALIDTRLRVVTWNLWGRGGPWEARLAGITSTLVAARPDVVALQEVWEEERGRNQAAVLAEALGFQHVWASRFAIDGVAVGNAILSRWPIVESEIRAAAGTSGAGGAAQRRACVGGRSTRPARDLHDAPQLALRSERRAAGAGPRRWRASLPSRARPGPRRSSPATSTPCRIRTRSACSPAAWPWRCPASCFTMPGRPRAPGKRASRGRMPTRGRGRTSSPIAVSTTSSRDGPERAARGT